MKVQKGSRGITTLSLTSAGDGVDDQLYAPRGFTSRKGSVPPGQEGGGLRGRSGQRGKSRPPPAFDHRTFQPVVSYYTNWATPDDVKMIDNNFKVSWRKWRWCDLLTMLVFQFFSWTDWRETKQNITLMTVDVPVRTRTVTHPVLKSKAFSLQPVCISTNEPVGVYVSLCRR
jgi:hypothetical protein